MIASKNNSFKEIWDKLKKCKRVAMTLHTGPDGDSLGSCAAMKYILERDLGCKVTLVSGDPLEENVGTMPYAKEVQFGKDFATFDWSECDVALCLDSATLGMLSSKQKGTFVFPPSVFVIQLDHHATNLYYGAMNYVDKSMPSACSVLVEMFKQLKIKFDAEVSRRLLLGICTDTGFFAYDSSPLIAMKQAVFLIEQGVDYYNEISRPIRLSESLGAKKLFALLINNIKVNERGRFAYSHVSLQETKKMGLSSSELRGGIRALQDLKNVDFVFTLTEVEGYIKGAFRSSANVDVSLFAKALGGGGHKTAAGFYFSGISLAEAEKKVLAVIEKVGIHHFTNKA